MGSLAHNSYDRHDSFGRNVRNDRNGRNDRYDRYAVAGASEWMEPGGARLAWRRPVRPAEPRGARWSPVEPSGARRSPAEPSAEPGQPQRHLSRALRALRNNPMIQSWRTRRSPIKLQFSPARPGEKHSHVPRLTAHSSQVALRWRTTRPELGYFVCENSQFSVFSLIF